jgi:putative nucleotidyltransferase with HDIG domain
MDWTPEKLAKEVLTVTSLPTVYIKLVETANNLNSSCDDFVAIISEDVGLSVRLMKLVNSAFFGYPSKIDSLSRAVTIVGIKQLQDLALATSVFDTFKNIPNDFVTMEAFWKHSIACGLVAKILANYRREFNVERAFLSGLLHDIGRLIIFMVIPKMAKTSFDSAHSQNQLLYQVEKQVMGFNHAAVGGALLKQWKLPEQIIYAVKYHHTPLAANRFKADVALVHVADLIIAGLAISSSGERLVPPLKTEAWDELGLPDNILDSLLIDFNKQYQDAVSIIMSGSDD